ncbi:polysaccharide deacetylase family protein [Parasedimentitalea psychrophila]|uniref:Polysaccharide deacetylase family protein n=1 Tax=Parasedimentitalea psychrophila TaxID=2997337 RepID=A0A9Y2P7M4_9RHOB|nr:polysaccharide deacetylase family protein [Parasedimentitalea psychrophila]WIY26178.1 polysaccharide deacetylase family protein [Parasedimentitalea psychrophila]
MSPDWTALEQELQAWQDQGLTLPLWWRDDDAIEPTPQLDRLTSLSETLNLPVHLAVIPRDATPALASYIASSSQLIPVVHGWAHQNHAPQDEKKAEFGAHRPIEQALADAGRGLDALRDLLGDAVTPMFVPPWNRITDDITQGLARLGYTSLSTYKPRSTAEAAAYLAQINSHLDPIQWKGSRSLVPPQQLLDQVSRQLNSRRHGLADNAEPYGILTHHLVHDTAIWDFTEALIRRLLGGPATPWTHAQRTTP